MRHIILKAPMGVCESLSKEWNEANNSGNKELRDRLTKECWLFRIYCERIALNE